MRIGSRMPECQSYLAFDMGMSFIGRSRQGHWISLSLTAQHHNSNDIDGSMRNSSRDQAESDQSVAQQYGRKEYECGVSPTSSD